RLVERPRIEIHADDVGAHLTQHLDAKARAAGHVEYPPSGCVRHGEAISAAMLAPQLGRRIVEQVLVGAHAAFNPIAPNSSSNRCCHVWSRRARASPALRMRSTDSGCANTQLAVSTRSSASLYVSTS